MALLNVECMLDLEAPMPYDADDVSFDQSQLSSEDYSISFDIHSEGVLLASILQVTKKKETKVFISLFIDTQVYLWECDCSEIV